MKKLILFLDQLKKNKIKKIIYDSSFQIFGKNNKFLKEIIPENYYGLSKLSAEKILINWCKKYNITLHIFRYPRIVSEDNKNFLFKMIESAKEKNEIHINTDKKLRLVHINDVINANKYVIEKKTKDININNISLKKEYSLFEIDKIIKNKINKKIKIKKNYLSFKNNDFEPENVNLSDKFFKNPKKIKPMLSLKLILQKMINKYEIN